MADLETHPRPASRTLKRKNILFTAGLTASLIAGLTAGLNAVLTADLFVGLTAVLIAKKRTIDEADLAVITILICLFLIAITAASGDVAHSSRDADGYPLAGFDEVPTAKQSSANAE